MPLAKPSILAGGNLTIVLTLAVEVYPFGLVALVSAEESREDEQGGIN